MLKFFDYLFYRTCEYYRPANGSDGYKFSAACLTGCMQGLNVAVVLFLCLIIFKLRINFSSLHAAAYGAFFIGVNLIRYNSNRYNLEPLQEQWSFESENVRRKRKNILVAYVSLSLLSFVILAAYLGKS
jgi:hypothetical protein